MLSRQRIGQGGVVANFARKPQSNDTGQLRAVAAGECSITVANTYYLGRLLGSAKAADQAVVENLGVLFPNQAGRGKPYQHQWRGDYQIRTEQG